MHVQMFGSICLVAEFESLSTQALYIKQNHDLIFNRTQMYQKYLYSRKGVDILNRTRRNVNIFMHIK